MQDNIRTFVKKGLDKEPRKMRSSLFLSNFFSMLGIAYGLILGGEYRVFSALITFSVLISFVLVVILTKKQTVSNTIKASICFNIFTAANYLLFAMILYSMHNKVLLNLILLSLPLILVAILTILFIVQSVKKEKTMSSKSKNASIGTIAGATSVVTYLMLKRLNVAMEQNVALVIGAVLLMLLSSLFVVIGVLNIMKLYYVKKFHISIDE